MTAETSIICRFIEATLAIDSVAGIDVIFDEDSTVFHINWVPVSLNPISDERHIIGKYRYFGSVDPEFDDGTDIINGEYHSHSLVIGLYYSF